MLKGIDVSSAQGKVQWDKLGPIGLRFCFIKSAEKDYPVDTTFAANVAGARAAGLVVGTYMVPHPIPSLDPKEQAQRHCSLSGALGAKSGDLPPVADLEVPAPQDWAKYGCSAGQIRAWLLAYLAEVEALWGVAPLVYSYPYWLQAIGVASEPEFARYGLWMADYSRFPKSWPTDGSSPVIPKPWASWTFWQHAGGTAMNLPGGGPVDTSVFNGDATALQALCARPTPTSSLIPLVQTAIDTTANENPPEPDDLPPAA